MNSKLKFTVLCVLISLLVATIMVLWGPYYFTWQGPSPAFKNQYDLNRDGQISRIEWEGPAFGTNISSSSVAQSRQFIEMDCDENGRLTWEEYRNYRYEGKRCGISPLYAISEQVSYQSTFSGTPPFPVVLTEDELEILSNSDIPSQKMHPGALQAPDGIYEQGLEGQVAQSIDFDCRQSETRYLPVAYNDSEGFRISVSCKTRNLLSETAITLLVLGVNSRVEGERQASIHVKSIFLETAAEQTVIIFFEPGSRDPRIQLLDARGMPDI